MTSAPITIRPATPDDAVSLARLASLDSAPVPAGRMLLAEVDGELRAALSLVTGEAIADPFKLTSHLVALLRGHARALQARPRAARRRPWRALSLAARPTA